MTAPALLEWFERNARSLPWRVEPRDPFHVLVSEIMLQQTQVDRVAPRFVSFVERFPSLADLASAREEDVVAEWSGLGYYRRARMLHRLAREVEANSGMLPTTASELEELPGIGGYTAAAVASMAFGEAVPVLDGNTLRVGSRNLALKADSRSADSRRRIGAWIRGIMEGEPAGAINEALMELGATLCTPHDPGCARCPFAGGCAARAEGRPEIYPPPRHRRATIDLRWVAACCVDREGLWLLKRIDEGPILTGLWLPPLCELKCGADAGEAALRALPDGAKGTPLVGPVIRHSITHRRIDVFPVRFDVSRTDPVPDSWRWVDPHAPGVPTSSLLGKLVKAVSD